MSRRNVSAIAAGAIDAAAVGSAVLVKDMHPSGSSSPAVLQNVNGELFFQATNGAHGVELWTSDGTETGTVLVQNILGGSQGSSYGRSCRPSSRPGARPRKGGS